MDMGLCHMIICSLRCLCDRDCSLTIYPTAGNVTHTSAYGNLIALGILDAVQPRHPVSDHTAAAIRRCSVRPS